ncbi:MAG: class I SAM-dependent methyltransferase [Ilumatobacteraceae bacterium]
MTPPADSTGVPTGNFYDKYAASNPLERRMMQGFFDSLNTMIDGLRPMTILEVGVGEGEVLSRVMRRFPDATARGVDLEDDRLAAIWRDRGLPVEVGDATSLQFEDHSVDLVLAIEVLEHIPDPERALREIARVAKSDVVVSVPREPIWRLGNLARCRYVGALGNTPGHVNHWNSGSFREFVHRELDVKTVLKPLPWTMIHASVRQSA